MAHNLYRDTRGNTQQGIPFSHAVVKGLAHGGGLFVPDSIPHLSLNEICALAAVPYAKRAAAIYRAFGVDFCAEHIEKLMENAYGSQFDTPEICPITSLDESTHVLELWHGPTSAFKDMALQCLPLFFSASAEKMRDQGALDTEFLILVATSGDTGKAALEGFADIPGVSISVLFPDGGVSDIQRKQMVTQAGNNVMVWAVKGNFDDCQTAVKQTFDDRDFAHKLYDEHRIALSSANSINWGRLLPQIVYYVSGYSQMVRSGKISAGDPIDVCVPTGNFGNILAAWYAKQMGTPIERLLCASNENRVLTDFINTGTYDIRDRPFVLTPSPSMDILVSSNLERQLFELTHRDEKRIASWMQDLARDRKFRVDAETFASMREQFAADSVSNIECLETIKEVFDTYNYLVDPHTAVALRVAQQLRGDNPILVASTAHWAKFGDNVYRALYNIAPCDPLPKDVAALTGCKLNEHIAALTHQSHIPSGLAGLDSMPSRFDTVIENGKASVESHVLDLLSQ